MQFFFSYLICKFAPGDSVEPSASCPGKAFLVARGLNILRNQPDACTIVSINAKCFTVTIIDKINIIWHRAS